jgi:hypothetical protein
MFFCSWERAASLFLWVCFPFNLACCEIFARVRSVASKKWRGRGPVTRGSVAERWAGTAYASTWYVVCLLVRPALNGTNPGPGEVVSIQVRARWTNLLSFAHSSGLLRWQGDNTPLLHLQPQDRASTAVLRRLCAGCLLQGGALRAATD